MITLATERLLDADNEQEVLEWRFAQLRGAGYPEPAAAELAARADVDLHLAVRMLRDGCPPALALRILR